MRDCPGAGEIRWQAQGRRHRSRRASGCRFHSGRSDARLLLRGDSPEPFLVGGKEKLKMSLQALEAWPSWLEELNEDVAVKRRIAIRNGTYVILNSKGGRLDSLNYQAILDALQSYGRKFETVPFGDVPNLDPVVDARPLAATYIPDEGGVDAREVLESVVAAARGRGVTFLDDMITGWNRNGDRATSVVTAAGDVIEADRFLVAAGAHSGALLNDLSDGDRSMPPVLAGKGIAMTCESSASGISHVVRTPNRAGDAVCTWFPATERSTWARPTTWR
ncbi:FAD-dependent oxidoreductase [Streptacidiphilus sp. 4-A2]|nr:FAD-dependent oxidoreductase [Streptacidiphilus sp. 4-A2]